MQLHRQGRIAEAEAAYGAVLSRNPRQFEALHLLGLIRYQQSRLGEAHQLVARAVEIKPHASQALSVLAVVLLALGRPAEALAICDRLLVIDRRDATTHYNRGVAFAQLGRLDDALAAYDRALAQDSTLLPALFDRGNVLARRARYDEALACYDRLLARAPGHVDALTNRGNALRELGRQEEAVACYDKLLAMRPDHLRALHNRAIALRDLGRFEQALASANLALSIDSSSANVWFERANALQCLERHEEAIEDYQKALELKADFPDAKWHASMSCLTLGRLADGWPLYEARLERVGPGVAATTNETARWNGEYVHGSLLIWGEQGLGDQIMYASLISDLSRCADQILVEVEPRLVALFARSFPAAQITGLRQELYGRPFDAHEVLGSLPRRFRPDLDAFPRRAYLVPDPVRTESLRARIAADGRLVIGVSWISANPKLGRFKTAQLRDLAPLLRLPGCRFIDLQYGDTLAERELVARELGVEVERLDIDNTNDIDGLAALIAACDVVVTVSNTTAHLAGAVGRPTWVMVPRGRGRLWYWFRDLVESPWYPHARVRRLKEDETWSDLVAAIAEEVSRFARLTSANG